jgi:hypothetical protein
MSGSGAGDSRASVGTQSPDPDCLDGTTETRDSGNMVDWMLSVASKPRRSSSTSSSHPSGAADSSSNSHGDNRASAAVQPPAPPASGSNGVGGNSTGGSAHVAGGRGGVVSALAVETPQAGPASGAAPLLPAEPALAPEDCEPDWQLRAKSTSGFGALGLLTKPQQRSHRGSVGVQVAQQQQQAVALRRHNNRLLAEAGVLSNVMPWTVSASTHEKAVELQPEGPQPEQATAAEPQPLSGDVQPAARVPAPGAAAVGQKTQGEVQLDDYVI